MTYDFTRMIVTPSSPCLKICVAHSASSLSDLADSKKLNVLKRATTRLNFSGGSFDGKKRFVFVKNTLSPTGC